MGRTFDYKVNCFCVSEFFFRETQFRKTSADHLLDFVAEHFVQVKDETPISLVLVWSRSSLELPIGEIEVRVLAERPPGFPFGLVLEHSYVQLDRDKVFQKADPEPASEIQIVSMREAVEPYLDLVGFEQTRHVPKFQF